MNDYKLSPAMRRVMIQLSHSSGKWWHEVPFQTVYALKRRGMAREWWHDEHGRRWELTKAGRVAVDLLKEIEQRGGES